MNSQQDKSQRNLAFLSYMGSACQLVGTLGAFSTLVGWWVSLWGPPASAIGWAVLFVFGLALTGWASNLSLINDLKKRLSVLEDRLSKEADS